MNQVISEHFYNKIFLSLKKFSIQFFCNKDNLSFGNEIIFYDNSEKGIIINTKRKGYWIFYYYNGEVFSYLDYTKEKSYCINYYMDGEKEFEGIWNHTGDYAVRDGFGITYSNNGNKIMEGTYKQDLKNGFFIFYSNNVKYSEKFFINNLQKK